MNANEGERGRENEITQPGKIMRREISGPSITDLGLSCFFIVFPVTRQADLKPLANVSNETRRKLDTRQEKERK